MIDFLSAQLDYIFFLYGTGFLLLAVACKAIQRVDTNTRTWATLGVFGFVHGVNEWLDMLALSMGDSPAFKATRVIVMAFSFVLLTECGLSFFADRKTTLYPHWITLVLVAAAASTGINGIADFNACCRYFLCLVGGLITAAGFYKHSRQYSNIKQKQLYVTLAWTFGLYAVAAGLIVPKANIYLSPIINHGSFLQFFHFPVQLLRGTLALISVLCLWLLYRENRQIQRFPHAVVFTALFVVVIAFGWHFTNKAGKLAQQKISQNLLLQSRSTTAALDTKLLNGLGSGDDTKLPQYGELRRRLIQINSANPNSRWTYLMVMKEGKVYFSVDSEPTSSAQYSPPGDQYSQAPRELLDVFQNRREALVTDYSDDWGSWTSVFQPIHEEDSKQILAVVGIDVPQKVCQANISRERLEPILVTLFTIALLCCFYVAYETVSDFVLSATQAEKRARDSEEQLRLYIDQAPDSILVVDSDGNYLDANPAALQMLRLSKDQLLQMSILDIAGEEHAQEALRSFAELKENGSSTCEMSIVGDLGKRIYADFSARRLGEGRYISFCRNITARKELEAALASERERLAITLESIGDAVIAVDMDYRIVLLNGVAENLTGWNQSEAIGRPFDEVFKAIDEDTRVPCECPVTQVLKTGTAYDLADDAILISRDGSVCNVADSCAPIRDGEGEVVGAVVVFRDVSRQKQAEAAVAQQARQLKEVTNNIPGVVYQFYARPDGEFGLYYISERSADILGLNSDTSTFVDQFIACAHPDDRQRLVESIEEAVSQSSSWEYEGRYIKPNGEELYIKGLSRITSDVGELLFTGVILDTTEQQRVKEELIRANLEMQNCIIYANDMAARAEFRREELDGERSNLQAIFEASQVGMLIVDESFKVTRLNDAAAQLGGGEIHEMSGQRPGDAMNCANAKSTPLGCGKATNCFKCQMRDTILHVMQTGEVVKGAEVLYESLASGAKQTLCLSVNAARLEIGGKRPVLLAISDVSERKRAEAALDHQAHHDTLTGLPNRREFKERLAKATSTSSRRRKDKLVLMFVDLDKFKLINDTLGHEVGDKLLIQVSQRLKSSVRKTDFLARMGGDEFTALLPHITNISEAAIVADRMLQSLTKPFEIDSHKFSIGASIGIAVYPDDAKEPKNLLKNADAAMYAAKEAGRNRYEWYTGKITEKATTRMEMERDLRTAMENGQLDVHYQPIMNVATGKIQGAEALLRWNHPEKGMVSPGLFVPVAEETGLINPIGDFVMRKACTAARKWHESGHWGIEISVNVSSKQFYDGAWMRSLNQILMDTSLDPNRLCLEITETTLAESEEQQIEVLSELRKRGLRISIDDFGIGYSSLGRLKQFPINHMKVDGSFIRGIAHSTKDRAMTESIIKMAHTLGVQVTAEWVESEEQLTVIRDLGCDYAQGYLVSPPIPEADFARMLAENASSEPQLAA